MHFAAGHGHSEVAELLVARGATVKAVDSDGRTPLHWAALEEHGDVGNGPRDPNPR